MDGDAASAFTTIAQNAIGKGPSSATALLNLTRMAHEIDDESRTLQVPANQIAKTLNAADLIKARDDYSLCRTESLSRDEATTRVCAHSFRLHTIFSCRQFLCVRYPAVRRPLPTPLTSKAMFEVVPAAHAIESPSPCPKPRSFASSSPLPAAPPPSGRPAIQGASATHGGVSHTADMAKTPASIRGILIQRVAADALRGRVEKLSAAGNTNPEALLFGARGGGAMSPANWRRAWRSTRGVGKFAFVHPHTLRATYASLCLKVGGQSAEAVAFGLGHGGGTEVLYRHYVHRDAVHHGVEWSVLLTGTASFLPAAIEA